MTDEEIEQIALANGFKRKRQPDGSMALNPYVLDFARALLASASQDIPEGWTLLPVELTAENGMKAALMGEFHVPLPDLDENGNEYIRKINVPWIVIKKIHQAVVATAPPPPLCPHPADDKLRKAAKSAIDLVLRPLLAFEAIQLGDALDVDENLRNALRLPMD